MTAAKSQSRIAIVGAGFSGMAAAIRLLQAGQENIVIYEKADDVGGTWHHNRYPGLCCDTPAKAYVYSFEPTANWSSLYPKRDEIHDYCRFVAEKYGLIPRIRFGQEICRAEYDGSGHWQLETRQGLKDTADVVIMATGVLHHPYYPDITGMDTFAGATVHTACWDDDLDLSGKRVGVIGTGATAVQLVPAIVDQVGTLTVFQRSAQWISPSGNKNTPQERRDMLRRNPELMFDEYHRVMEKIETLVEGLRTMEDQFYRDLRDACQAHLETITDPELRRKMTPGYDPGCKRLIFADKFYPAIQKENADVVIDAIQQIEPAGIRTADGALHELDVLILATGYRMHDYMRPMGITGADGLALDHVWEKGAFAHRGMTVPGFPNMFMLVGPNSPLTNYPVIAVAEIQMEYLMQLIQPVLDGRYASVCATPAATEKFNKDLVEATANTVWTTGCDSYYINDAGIPNVWPWSIDEFKASMQAPELSEYLYERPAGLSAEVTVQKQLQTGTTGLRERG